MLPFSTLVTKVVEFPMVTDGELVVNKEIVSFVERTLTTRIPVAVA